MMRLSLTEAEVITAAIVGVRRQAENLGKHRRPVYGKESGGPWQVHIEGCIGEAVVAKALNLYWSGNLGDLHAADVGHLQVRTTRRLDGRLILHPEDADQDCWLLVCQVSDLEYAIPGWLRGHEGKQERFWYDPGTGRPAFFVDQKYLHPLDTLPLLRGQSRTESRP